jgi:ABC-2 type transport system ATP-binding protein
MSTPALELQGVTKRFGHFTAVRDLSFTQTRGAILGFLGPNGAGKTTTLRMMLGLMAPDAGTLNVLGVPSGARQSMRIGYLPEERGLYKRMRADRVIAYIAALKGMELGAARKRARDLLHRFGLGAYMDTRVEALSKGMAQKVALIASLAHDPELLILDEPFSGLDPINQHSFEDTIRDLAAEGKTVLFSTHTMEQAERLCDHLVILARGQKVFDGTPDQARAVLPRRVRIGADGDLGFLSAVPGVVTLTPPNGQGRYWEAALSSGADSAALLAACFDARMAVTHFDVSDASLQDAFIALAGAEEREAAQ